MERSGIPETVVSWNVSGISKTHSRNNIICLTSPEPLHKRAYLSIFSSKVNTLRESGSPAHHTLCHCLKLLEYRGCVVGYGFTNSDGIHGWLRPDEIREFVTLLNDLHLPVVKPDRPGLQQFQTVHGSLYYGTSGRILPVGCELIMSMIPTPGFFPALPLLALPGLK